MSEHEIAFEEGLYIDLARPLEDQRHLDSCLSESATIGADEGWDEDYRLEQFEAGELSIDLATYLTDHDFFELGAS